MRPRAPSYRAAVQALSLGCLLTVAACAEGPAHPVMTTPPAKRATTSGSPSPGTAEVSAGWPRQPTTQVVFSGSRHHNLVALTFDSNLTPTMIQKLRQGRVRSYDNHAVIDELIGLHVRATFFLSGLWMLQYPAETRRIAASPLFEVGIHSFGHRGFRPRCYDLGTLPVTQMATDVIHAEQVLARFTDRAPPLTSGSPAAATTTPRWRPSPPPASPSSSTT